MGETLLRQALTDRINNRTLFMKGVDYYYHYYEQEDDVTEDDE
jgi:cell filamentation protein